MLRSLGRLQRIAVNGRNSVMKNLPAATSVQFFGDGGNKLTDISSEPLSKRLANLVPKAKQSAELTARENQSGELTSVSIVQQQQW